MQLIEFFNLLAAVLVGGLLTFIATQLIKRVGWPSWLKIILSLVMAGVFALATAWLNGDVRTVIHAWGSLTSGEVLTLGTLMWTTATVWYHVVFKDASWAKSIGNFPKRE